MRDLSEKIENNNQCSIMNKFMHERLCYKSSTFKNEKLNGNINISEILHLPFDILCYLLKSMMEWCKTQ